MSNALRDSISALAATFATSVVAAIRSSNLADIVDLAKEATATPRGRATATNAAPAPRAKRTRAKSPKKQAKKVAPAAKPAAKSARKAGGRLARRSPADIAKALAKVVALVKEKGGLRSEQVRDALKMDKKEMPRVLKEGLVRKVLKSKGQKRSTVYSPA